MRAETGRGRGQQLRQVLGRQLVAGIERRAERLFALGEPLVVSIVVAHRHDACLPR